MKTNFQHPASKNPRRASSNFFLQISKMPRQRGGLKDGSDEVSQLICCVRRRPPLYNYKLSPQLRRRVDVVRGWEEVADEIGGKVTAEECRKKWKNLRDTYHQYRLRKSKFKNCLEKWRYTKDLEFLADIYQPKLKSQRSRYAKEYAALSNKANTPSSIYEEKIEFQRSNDETISENDYCGSIEDVVEVEEVKFSDVSTAKETTGEVYEEVCLYEDGEASVVSMGSVGEVQENDTKFNISKVNSVAYVENDRTECLVSSPITIGHSKDELDLFFQFLKSKIQKLPSVDITAIQIEFLNVVLRKEYATTLNSKRQT